MCCITFNSLSNIVNRNVRIHLHFVLIFLITMNIIYTFGADFYPPCGNMYVLIYNTTFYNNLHFLTNFGCFFEIFLFIISGLLKNTDMLLENNNTTVFKKLLFFDENSSELYNYNMQILQISASFFIFFLFFTNLFYFYQNRLLKKIF